MERGFLYSAVIAAMLIAGCSNGPTVGGGAQSVHRLSSPANGATNQDITITLSWQNVPYSVGFYGLQVSTASDFSTFVLNQALSPENSYPLVGLNWLTTYYWRVNATDTGTTGWSDIWSFTTSLKLVAPANGATNQDTAIVLSWLNAGTAMSYNVQVSTGPAFSTFVLNQPNLSSGSWVISGLIVATTYYWRVITSAIKYS